VYCSDAIHNLLFEESEVIFRVYATVVYSVNLIGNNPSTEDYWFLLCPPHIYLKKHIVSAKRYDNCTVFFRCFDIHLDAGMRYSKYELLILGLFNYCFRMTRFNSQAR
jgi:hypothetical protein